MKQELNTVLYMDGLENLKWIFSHITPTKRFLRYSLLNIKLYLSGELNMFYDQYSNS